ncbi:MAG: hypothetical protein OXC03_02260 [Flavobacteriaceae bacterium]|nr:hypothetical protein [Flavobacteriaceae bacterium]
MFSPDTAHCEVPPKKAPGGDYIVYILDDTYQWHRAVKDMMTGNKQVQYNCGGARGNKTFTCNFE